MVDYNEQTNEQISISMEKYTQRLAYTGQGLVEYIGLAFPGASESAAVWQIRKLVYTGTNVTSILWALGNNNFSNKWSEYDSIDYS